MRETRTGASGTPGGGLPASPGRLWGPLLTCSPQAPQTAPRAIPTGSPPLTPLRRGRVTSGPPGPRPHPLLVLWLRPRAGLGPAGCRSVTFCGRPCPQTSTRLCSPTRSVSHLPLPVCCRAAWFWAHVSLRACTSELCLSSRSPAAALARSTGSTTLLMAGRKKDTHVRQLVTISPPGGQDPGA